MVGRSGRWPGSLRSSMADLSPLEVGRLAIVDSDRTEGER